MGNEMMRIQFASVADDGRTTYSAEFQFASVVYSKKVHK